MTKEPLTFEEWQSTSDVTSAEDIEIARAAFEAGRVAGVETSVHLLTGQENPHICKEIRSQLPGKLGIGLGDGDTISVAGVKYRRRID